MSKKTPAPLLPAPPQPATPLAEAEPRDGLYPYADFARAQEALARILGGPFYALLLGPSGTGKTLLLRHLSASLDRHRFQPVYLVAESRLGPTALARVLALAAHLPLRRTHAETTRALAQLLRARLAASRLVVLVDEAQRLEDEALDALRLLAESELDAPPLFSVLLTGSPELKERFDRADLFAFKRRLTLRVELTGLRVDECRPFLARRLGQELVARLRDDALSLIFERGRGVPALVERCAALALEHGRATGPIGKQTAADALETWEA